MYTPQQIWRQATPKAQLLIALALATILAFSAGLGAGIYGRATSLPALTTHRNAGPAVAAPVAGAGPAYDGSAYVEYLTGRSAAHNPNVPIHGAGSAYDGSAYVEYLTGRSAAHTPNVPISGTGSVYDGTTYRSAPVQVGGH